MDSWYLAYTMSDWLDDSKDNILEMFTDAEAEDGIFWVVWVGELASYWHKDPDDRSRIEHFPEDVGKVDWDQAFHVVPYGVISNYTRLRPTVNDPEEELIGSTYG